MLQHQVFKHRHTVRFGEIDYAGIVYYPNFFDFYQQTEEEFMHHLGYPYPHLLGTLKQGFPIIHVQADFKNPVRYGDQIEIALTIAHLGTSSVTFHFDVYKAGQNVVCATANIGHVLIDTVAFKSIPIPAEMRAKLSAFKAP